MCVGVGGEGEEIVCGCELYMYVRSLCVCLKSDFIIVSSNV